MLRFINLKEDNPSLDYALALVELEIENAKIAGDHVIKVLHGYGSHGKGGVILVEIRKFLKQLKKQKLIKDYLSGDGWSVFNREIFSLLNQDKTMAGDEDLDRNNPGITIIIL